MPFDLKIHYLPLHDHGQPWSMKGPGWLDRAPLPFDPAQVREIHSPGYRDRYVPISAEELRAWHDAQFAPLLAQAGSFEALSASIQEQHRVFMLHPGEAPDETVYILHWEEWESGM